MEVQFKGKKALVTGVGKGIGKAIVVALVAGGATVHGISRNQTDLDILTKEVPGIHVYNVELTDWEKTRDTLKQIGHVDLLVNNAGIFTSQDFIKVSKDDLLNTFDHNVYSVFNVSQFIAEEMIKNNIAGSIVNISSVGAYKPREELSLYSISKASVDMLTKCMALELGKHKIRVNSVNPSLVKTEKIEALIETDPTICDFYLQRSSLSRIPEMEDVVNAVLYLLSDKADMITGCLLPIDGGEN